MASHKSTARTPEAREEEMIALATDEIERRIRDGSAPAPVLMMYAKAGLGREKLERIRLERENTLLRAKVEAMEAATQSNDKLDAVLRAFRTYSGDDDVDTDIF